jgi:hypothetical protein
MEVIARYVGTISEVIQVSCQNLTSIHRARDEKPIVGALNSNLMFIGPDHD